MTLSLNSNHTPMQQDCEVVATMLRKCLAPRIPVRTAPHGVDGACSRADLAKELQGMWSGPDPQPSGPDPLHTLVADGIAYHHAGLSSSERLLVEKGFRTGGLSVLVATSTLSAGINLPARRVILRHCWNFEHKGKALLSPIVYRQMCGRAGRAGQDDRGEAVLMQTEPVTEQQLRELMTVRADFACADIGVSCWSTCGSIAPSMHRVRCRPARRRWQQTAGGFGRLPSKSRAAGSCRPYGSSTTMSTAPCSCTHAPATRCAWHLFVWSACHALPQDVKRAVMDSLTTMQQQGHLHVDLGRMSVQLHPLGRACMQSGLHPTQVCMYSGTSCVFAHVLCTMAPSYARRPCS